MILSLINHNGGILFTGGRSCNVDFKEKRIDKIEEFSSIAFKDCDEIFRAGSHVVK